jgi:hypothetical protein
VSRLPRLPFPSRSAGVLLAVATLVLVGLGIRHMSSSGGQHGADIGSSDRGDGTASRLPTQTEPGGAPMDRRPAANRHTVSVSTSGAGLPQVVALTPTPTRSADPQSGAGPTTTADRTTPSTSASLALPSPIPSVSMSSMPPASASASIAVPTQARNRT